MKDQLQRQRLKPNIYICTYGKRKLGFREIQRGNHAKLQYNVELRLIIQVQRNLHKQNPLKIDGDPGGSPFTFRIWKAPHIPLPKIHTKITSTSNSV